MPKNKKKKPKKTLIVFDTVAYDAAGETCVTCGTEFKGSIPMLQIDDELETQLDLTMMPDQLSICATCGTMYELDGQLKPRYITPDRMNWWREHFKDHWYLWNQIAIKTQTEYILRGPDWFKNLVKGKRVPIHTMN